MEQRIGQSTPPVHGAGIDPAYVPGLTFPPPGGAAESALGGPAEQPPEEAAAAEAPEREILEAEGSGEADLAERDEGDRDREEPADGPVFKVSDRRGSITADHTGVTFRLDNEEAEFRWDEIGAVEIDTPRFGRRFTVTVYTTTRRWYEADVEAPARSLLKTWTAELDAVLDARFEDGEE